jgi:hypothetical protein
VTYMEVVGLDREVSCSNAKGIRGIVWLVERYIVTALYYFILWQGWVVIMYQSATGQFAIQLESMPLTGYFTYSILAMQRANSPKTEIATHFISPHYYNGDIQSAV